MDFLEVPTHKGTFGPMVILNAASGRACVRFDDGRVVGQMPEGPLTNAFFVWVGRVVVVVSSGVAAEDLPVVASRLRDCLGAPNVPVVASGGTCNTYRLARSDDPTAEKNLQELARAEAYVLVQNGWVEDELIRVELDGQRFDFRVAFRPGKLDMLTPVIE